MKTKNNSLVIYQLLYVLGGSTLGRRTLVDQTGITEMTIRTHLNRLRDGGWVVMKKAGTELTPKAKRSLAPFFSQIVEITPVKLSRELAVEAFNVAALLRACKDAVRRSLYLRDVAVRAGASGAVFLVREASGWKFINDGTSLNEKNPADAQVLESAFEPERGDVLVIAFAANMRTARGGLWSVISEIIPIKFS